MGAKQDIEEALKIRIVTKIYGQLTDDNLNQLKQELSAHAASIPTTNGGGMHGHIEILLNNAKYIAFSCSGASFVIPTNPGAYPTTVDQMNSVIQACQVTNTNCKESNSRLFIINKCAKCHKHNKATAKSASFRIANNVEETKPTQEDESTWVVVKVAYVTQQVQDKQLEKFIQLMTDMQNLLAANGTTAKKPVCTLQMQLSQSSRQQMLGA